MLLTIHFISNQDNVQNRAERGGGVIWAIRARPRLVWLLLAKSKLDKLTIKFYSGKNPNSVGL